MIYASVIIMPYTYFLEQIHTTHLPECQGTPCLKQAQILMKFRWEIQIQNHLVHK